MRSNDNLPNNQVVIYGDDTSRCIYQFFFRDEKIPDDKKNGFLDIKRTFKLNVENLGKDQARLTATGNNDAVLDIAILCIDTKKQGCMDRFYQYYKDIQNYFGNKKGTILVYCNNFLSERDYDEISMTAFWERNNPENISNFCGKNKISCFQWTNKQLSIPQAALVSHLYEMIQTFYERKNQRKNLCSNINSISAQDITNSIKSAKDSYAKAYYGSASIWYLEKTRGIPADTELDKIQDIEACFQLLIDMMQGEGGDTARSFKYMVLSAMLPELNKNIENDDEAKEAISIFLSSLKSSNYIMSPLKIALFSLWAANEKIPADMVNIINQNYISLYQNEKTKPKK